MADRVIFVCTLVLAGVYFYATEQLPTLEIGDPLGPKAFPRLLVAGLVITAGILLIEMIRGRKAVESDVPKGAGVDRATWLVVGGATIWTLIYFTLFEPLGYVVATAIYLTALTLIFNKRRPVMNITTSVLFALGSYLMFTKVLGVTLARGILPI